MGGVRGDALSIAADAFTKDYIERHTAATIASKIALFAADMLRESGAGDWDFKTLIALKKIRHSDPAVEAMCAPRAPKPAPVVAPTAE